LINAIAIVELARRKWVEIANTTYEAYIVLFQQVYSMIEQKYGFKYEYLNEVAKNSKAFEF
jgi:ATP-dependent Lhr-like helicase